MSMFNSDRSHAAHGGILLALLQAASPAVWAQESANELSSTPAAAGLEEIMVTAQRRSENLQEVPIAVAVATAEQLQASGVAGIEGLKMVAPGVEIQSNTGYILPFIRGVGSKGFGAGIESPIAVYVDGVYYAAASSSLMSFNNIEQIEVLKGPQGTLFGRNATGGLIQVQTRDPSAELGGSVSLSYGNYETLRTNAYLTGALSERLSADIAISGMRMGTGYGTNQYNGKDIYKVDHDVGVRSKWLLKAGDNTEARLTLDYSDTQNSMFVTRMPLGGTAPAPYGPSYGGDARDTTLDKQPNLEDDGGGIALRIDHEMDAFDVASITAYRMYDHFIEWDIDYTPTRGREAEVKQADWQFSQEFQLLSRSDGPLSWVLGAYYFRAESEYPFVNIRFIGIAEIPNPAGNFVLATTRSVQETDSLSGFGQATYALTDQLRITAGLRYTSEERTLADATSFNSRADGSFVTTVPLNTRSDRFNKLTWRTAVDYDFTPDVLGYVSYNRGFKSGGFNPSALSIGAFEPEVLDAYETGVKTSLFDRLARVNVAAYYYDYQNVQVQRAVFGATGIYNGAAAEIYGAEADLETRIGSALTVRASYQYTHGKYEDFTNALIATPRAAGGYSLAVGDASGNTTVLSPESTFGINGTYTFQQTAGDLELTAGVYYNSGYYHEPDNLIEQDAYEQVNASARWRSRDGWWVSVWGNNLTDSLVANLDGVQSLGAFGIGRVNYAPPRTYGITIGSEF